MPAPRQLGARLAISTDTLGTVSGIRQLSDGRVLVNDIGKRRLLLLDSSLSHPVIIADSTSSTREAYGSAQGGILAYRGDTTLFIDPTALSMLVVDPRGVVVRTVAPPRPSDAPALVIPVVNAALDGAGRIVYRGVRGAFCAPSGGCGYQTGSSTTDSSTARNLAVPAYALHDSIAILRGNVAGHTVDTVGFVAVPLSSHLRVTTNADGSHTVTYTLPLPIPIADDWSVVTDGSVAFVRGLDYHIDWVNADGSRSSTPRIAHDWHRLSDSDKAAILDSAKRHVDSTDREVAAQQARSDSIARANGRPVARHEIDEYVWPEPADLPDYRPAFVPTAFSGAVRADADNNLWIRQGGALNSRAGSGPSPVYDIVSRQGRLIDRIQLPPSLVLVGFGPGVVYLTSREGFGTVILKYRIR